MYTPFSTGNTLGNHETKINLCAFSHSIYSSPVHDLFAVPLGMKAQKHPEQLFFPRFCSIADQLMCLHSFSQWILPTPKNPSGTLSPLEEVNYAPMRLLPGAILPSFLSIFFPSCMPAYLSSVLSFLDTFFRSFLPRYLEPQLKKRASKWFHDMCHIEFLIGALCDPDRPLVQEILFQ